MVKSLISFLFLLQSLTAFPQPVQDTTFLVKAIQNSINAYRQAIGGQAKIHNGSKYLPPKEAGDYHPYFLSEDWLIGNVVYDEEHFDNVPLMFDILHSRLVTEHSSSGHAIQLIVEKLDQFSIAGHTFEKIDNASVNGSLPDTDFYDILYSGPTRVIAKRQKVLREKIVSNAIETLYDERFRYFLFKNGVFFQVKNKSAVLKILEDQKQPLKKFLKNNNMIFSDDKELALKRMAEFYDNAKKGDL
ncbi:MAG: hypothetical protein ABIR06_05110 [Cyclobacteriaceae bacterium]